MMKSAQLASRSVLESWSVRDRETRVFRHRRCLQPAQRRRLAVKQAAVTEQLDVRPAATKEELAQAAALRAEAYYEVSSG